MAWTEANRGSALKGEEQTRSVRSVARVQRRNKSGACRTLVSSGAQPGIFTRYPPPPYSFPLLLLLFVLFLPLTSDPYSSNLAIVGTLNARNRPATRRKRISRGLYKQIAVPLLPYLCAQTEYPPLAAVPKCRASTFRTPRDFLIVRVFVSNRGMVR